VGLQFLGVGEGVVEGDVVVPEELGRRGHWEVEGKKVRLLIGTRLGARLGCFFGCGVG
jgi:hypothetical protein